MACHARSVSYSCCTAISSGIRIALVVCLVAVAAAADVGMCSGSDGDHSTCANTKDKDGDSYDSLCRASFERIDELNQLAQSDAAVFVPQAWAWIEAAGKCVYAIDNRIIAEPLPSSSTTLQSHIVTFLRAVLSLDKSPLTPPPGSCAKLLLAKKKKSIRKLFDAVIPGGGLHPDLKIKDFTWNISTYDGVITDKVIRLRGVYSSSDIPSGTAVAFIPSSHLLHLSQFNRSKIWASLEKLPTPPNTNNVRILQTSVGMALMWGQQSLQATGDSGLLRAVDIIARDIADHMHMILPALEHRVPPKYELRDCGHTAHVTPLRNYVWATLAVYSRSFTFGASSEDGAGSKSHPEPGLAPFVDMVNHQENPHVMVQADVIGGVEMGLGSRATAPTSTLSPKYFAFKNARPGIAMSTIRDVKAGEEIYFSYGSHCAREWVVTYGFVPTEGLLPLSQCQGM